MSKYQHRQCCVSENQLTFVSVHHLGDIGGGKLLKASNAFRASWFSSSLTHHPDQVPYDKRHRHLDKVTILNIHQFLKLLDELLVGPSDVEGDTA